MPGPSKEVKRFLTEAELSTAIDEAQKADNTHLVRRLCFIRNLYEGDSVTEAARRVGVTQPTGSRWIEAWNEEAIAGLEPDFGGGRPPKLDDVERARFAAVLEEHGPLTMTQIQQLLEDGFDVTYSKRHLSRLLNELDVNHGRSRSEEIGLPEDAEERLEGDLQAALDELDDVVRDGGFALGYLDDG